MTDLAEQVVRSKRAFGGLLNDGSRLFGGWLSMSFVLDGRLVACWATDSDILVAG